MILQTKGEVKSDMKKRSVVLTLIVAVAVIAIVLARFFTYGGTTEEVDEGANQDMDAEIQEGMTEEQEEILNDLIYGTIYDTDVQDEIEAFLEDLKAADTYTAENILVQYNPYGSNTQSLYIYFQTEEAADVTYTVHVDSDDIGDFTQSAWQEEEYQTEHEFQVIGLIPDMENTVIFTITYEDGTVEEASITYEMGSLLGTEALQLEVTEYAESEELEDGLYVVMGNDSTTLDFMYYYDNSGVLRGEIPIIGYRSHRILFDDELMYFSVSEGKIACMNRLGKIEEVYTFGDYKLHHDYVFDDDGNLLVLATDSTADTEEDLILLLDVETGEITELIDMGDLFPDYKEECLARAEDDDSVDWIHLNTIQWMGDEADSIIVSSRETSTIIKLSNIYDGAEITYMIGSEEFWEGTDYEQYLYTQDGDFTIQGGQHSVTYVEDDSLEYGQYYLYMFNNNIGISNTNPDFDWASVGLTVSSAKNGDASYYYEYLVDENEGTFTLVDSFEVPYSGYVSSVQNLGSNTIVDSGMSGYIAEYDEDHELLISFTMDVEKFIYRVYKYDFN